jgi:demethylmenaquinone methyltransferase/2-methoxy-6-polyprenyl-1,4-benzoquinol methylase
MLLGDVDPAGFAEGERNARARRLFAGLGGDYDRWAAVLSCGQDPRWRAALVRGVEVRPDAHVLDVATGTAAVARALVRRCGCRVTGIDQSPEMLAGARERIAAAGLASRIDLVQGNAEALPFADASFDAVTATYLLRYVDDPAATVRELVRVARPGAPIGYLDFGLPPRGPLRAAWHVYTGVGLPLAGRLVAPAWHEVGRFLRGSIASFCARYPPAALGELFADAGMVGVRVRRMSFGGGVVLHGRRDGAG